MRNRRLCSARLLKGEKLYLEQASDAAVFCLAMNHGQRISPSWKRMKLGFTEHHESIQGIVSGRHQPLAVFGAIFGTMILHLVHGRGFVYVIQGRSRPKDK